jgi:pyruvate/2-oxoglutarate dehydrogenase complex dihydrolipoamide dehydrogenase (E3) component
MDVAKMLARKDKVVAQNNDGILYLFKKNKITFFHGWARSRARRRRLEGRRSRASSAELAAST